MDLKELSETVQQKQGATPVLTSPKRQIKSRFQLNLDKTIESCKAQLGQYSSYREKKLIFVVNCRQSCCPNAKLAYQSTINGRDF